MSAAWAQFLVLPAAVAALVAGAYAVLGPRRGSGAAYYDVPPEAVVAVLIAAFAAALGVVLVATRYRRWVALLSALTTALLLFGLLAILSIGIFVLLPALALLALTVRAARRTPDGGRAASSGASIAIGLAVLLLVVSQPPLVECHPHGVSSSSGSLFGGGASSGTGSATSSPDGETRGTMTYDGTTIHYVCRDGQLVEFEKTTSGQ